MSGEAILHFPVLLEPLNGRPGYMAYVGSPFHLSVEAATPEEALEELSRAARDRLGSGGRLASLSFPLQTAIPAGGWLPDDELTKEWLRAVEEYRRECDEADRRSIVGDSTEEKTAS